MHVDVRRKNERPSLKGPDNVDIHVGNRLRMARTLAGMSQTALGEAIGVSFQQVQKYETGGNRISASRLWRLAAVLGTPVSSFFMGLDGEPSGEPIQTRRRTLEIVRNLELCPPEVQENLHSAIQAISNEFRNYEDDPARQSTSDSR